jgi:glutamate/tyrosine decarboxylase-like PLP-dependent enzyme
MAQEAMGKEGYDELVDETLGLAAEVMEMLERAFGGPALLAGRGARGQFDGGARLHVRLYARAELPAIAQLLVDEGFEEPSFETVETVHGRANRVRTALDGVELAVTRCLPEWWDDRGRDLVTGRRTEARTLEEVQALADGEG